MSCLTEALGGYISKAERHHTDRKPSCAAKVTYQSAPISVDAQEPWIRIAYHSRPQENAVAMWVSPGGHVGHGAWPHSGQSGGPVAEFSPTRHLIARDASGMTTQSSMQESARSRCRVLGDHALDPICDGPTTVSPRGEGEKNELTPIKTNTHSHKICRFPRARPTTQILTPLCHHFQLFDGESV